MELLLNDALSIFAAARDAGEATALRIGEQQFTFGELADSRVLSDTN